MLTRRTFTTASMGVGLMGLFSLFGCGNLTGSNYQGKLIKGVSYTLGGGITGGSLTLDLFRQDDGSVKLETRQKTYHNSRAEGYDFVLDKSVFDRFADIANDYDLLKGSQRKYSELMALDAETGTISYSVMKEDGSYDSEASFSVSSDQELTSTENKGYRAARDELYGLATDNEGTYYLEPVTAVITVNGAQYQFYLNNSTAAQTLAAYDSFDIELESFGDVGKLFKVDVALDVSDAPKATAEAGSICYVADSGYVGIFCSDGVAGTNMYELGKMKDHYDTVHFVKVEPGPARFSSNYNVE